MRKSAWDYKIALDECLYEVWNMFSTLKFFLQGGAKNLGLQKNIDLKDKHKGKRCFVVGNAPSIKKQNLKLLKGEITYFVNRAFLLDEYEYIKPTYHVIIDPKLGTGEWSIEFLDEIKKKNPEVIFILNSEWRNKEAFKPYLSWNIRWVFLSKTFTRFTKKKMDLTTICQGGAVVEDAVLTAVYSGCEKIYLIGVDFTGLFYELLDMDSHAYGVNPENANKSMYTISKDLMFHSMAVRRWVYVDNYCRRHGINLINSTDGGIIDINREKYLTLFNGSK